MRNKLMITRILTPTLLAMLLFVAAGNAFGEIDPNALYHITAKNSRRCLAVTGGVRSLEDGVGVIQSDCIEIEENQKWQLLDAGDGYYRIIANHSHKALEVRGGVGALGNGDRVQQWGYVGAANQKWKLIPVGDEYYQIVAVHSGKSLDVNAGSGNTGDGAFVQQWDYWGGDNQKWRLTNVGPATTPVDPLQGRFRVTLMSFVVNTATVDGLLVGDGLGDEVYAVAEVAELLSSSQTRGARSLVSLTYGDTSADHGLPARIKAGNANPTTGGLLSGNSYPTPGDSLPMLRSPSSQARLIPMILWDGELRGGANPNAVVILPTIWEWDNDQVMLGHWQAQAPGFLRTFGMRNTAAISGREEFPLITRSDVLTETVNRNDFDHPIGIQGDAFVPLAAGTATFSPWRVFLTFSMAERLARTVSSGTVPGVFQITYEDGQRYGSGRYTLFLRVERLPLP